jgi:tetraacyldisaccharide 4'-kinase
VPLYAAGLAVKDGLRAAGMLKVKKLKWPVVSVGSLSAGGAGKTPVVIALAEMLNAAGWHVDVLSRGYRREGRGVEEADPAAEAAARRFGDEPTLIARRTGAAVWVGADRFAAGDAAEATAGLTARRVHLLDDGFQHRQLARAADIVLVTESDLEDALLPAGNRREPLTALARADAVVLREEELARIEPRVRALMQTGAVIWSLRRELRFRNPPSGTRLLAFSAIARPEGFRAMLEQAGCDLAGAVAFADHHIYGMDDMNRVVATASQCGATGLATTEKDAVKLSPAMLERLRSVGPVGVVALDAKFVEEADVMRELEARIS